MKHRLFVYGTLKRGQGRSALLAGQTFLGEARTEPHYRLYSNGAFPCLVEAEDGVSIQGELWKVDDACLVRLDAVEGVDGGLFERRLGGTRDADFVAVLQFRAVNWTGALLSNQRSFGS